MELLSGAGSPFGVPCALLREFSFCYDPAPALEVAGRSSSRPGSRKDFAVIGNFRHEPNADGVRWLKREIWPEIRRRLPQARVHVYGAYAPREMMALDSADEGFLMKGAATDQYETLSRHLVNLAPLRFGAGLKGKISDGWWCGTPCVTTSIGAEGMRLGPERSFGGMVVDEPIAFAEAACRLLTDEAERREAIRVGHETLASRFDHARNGGRLITELEDIRINLPRHRAANFTGRMLSHHHHRSTQYFSRWIEAKNRPPSAAALPPEARA
jgi:glycosyltransferase involved in cell wall biosynthesis